MENLTLIEMAERYFNEGENALFHSNYSLAIEQISIARAFYDKIEHLEGIIECDENISELLIHLENDPNNQFYWIKYGVERVNYFIEIEKQRKKLFGLIYEKEDPILVEVTKSLK